MSSIFPINNPISLIKNINNYKNNSEIKKINLKKNIKNIINNTTPDFFSKNSIELINPNILKDLVINIIEKLNTDNVSQVLSDQNLNNMTIKNIENKILSFIPILNFSEEIKNKNYKSVFLDFIKDYVDPKSNINNFFIKIIPKSFDLIESNLDGSQFINTINRSINVIKNILLINNNSINSENQTNNRTVEQLNSKVKKFSFFDMITNGDNWINFFSNSKIDSIFYSVTNNHIKFTSSHNAIKLNSSIISDMKDINWVSLNLMNELSSTNILSERIFNEAQKIKNIRDENINFISNNIIIDNKIISSKSNHKILNSFKVHIPDIDLRNLVLSCLKQDLISKPCLDIFYNKVEISKFNPERSAIFYSIENLKHRKIKLTATYLGHFIKDETKENNITYKNFGARTSVILSKNKLPEITYFNFIN